jgi:hypothetical protein
VKLRSVVLVMAATLVALGCGDAETSSATAPSPAPVSEWRNVSAGTIRTGDPIPTPEDEPVLSISGLVSNTNGSDQITIDLPTLEQLRLVELEVFEPFEKKRIMFEGVLMRDLLEIAGTDTAAREAHFTALDDYEMTIPMEEFSRSDVLLATKADGEHMSVEDGGPTRIVFPPDSAFSENTDAWIWNVEVIVVR